MSTAENERPEHSERRASYRCPVDGPRRAARLRAAGCDVAVTIVDESTGGIGVESDGPLRCQVGDKLLLEIAAAWIEVRVVHMDSLPSPSDAESSAPPRNRLGLVRIRDVEDWEIESLRLPTFSWESFRSLLRPLVPLGSSLKGTLAIIAAMIVVGIVLVVVLVNFGPMAEAMRDPAHQSISAPRAAHKPLAEIPQAERQAPRGPAVSPAETKTQAESVSEPARPAPTGNNAAPASPPPLDLGNEAVRRVVRAAQPDFLLRPEVAQRLALSEQQVTRLERLLEELRQAIAALGTGSLADSDERLVQFGARAWEILTDQQRRLFAALYVPPEPRRGPGAALPTAQAARPAA